MDDRPEVLELRALRPVLHAGIAGPDGLHYVPGYRLTVKGMTTDDQAWVPEACTLPTVDRPLRLAEFDDLFATSLRGQQRLSPTALRWRLDPSAEATARGLTARESSCCSFFLFSFAPDGDRLDLEVRVPAAHVDMLDALADRAAAGIAR
jgi:hypothetical protein